jgi:uncharacterized DUF497 family protein/predicted DNA binding CopG/RHH family protein
MYTKNRWFEWDALKTQENLRKHGVLFEEAAEAITDPHGIIFYDKHHSLIEDRFRPIGLSARNLLVVVFTDRQKNFTHRIISARCATRAESIAYYETKRSSQADPANPPLSKTQLRAMRRVTPEEHARFQDAYVNTFGKEPPRRGRPRKSLSHKYRDIHLKLHPKALGWAQSEAKRRGIGYQTLINEILLRHAA